MGIFNNIFGRQEQRSMANPPEWWLNAVGVSKTGITVNEQTSLGLTAVWACVQLISTTLAQLPIHIYRSRNDTREKVTNHQLSKILKRQPNPEMSYFDFYHIIYVQMLLHGAGIAEIIFNGGGNPVALYPIPTNTVQPSRTASGQLVYNINDSKGTRVKQPHQLLLIRYFPLTNGGWKSPIAVHRETLAIALATKKFGEAAFTQGTHPSGIISGIPKGLTEDAWKVLTKSFDQYSGMDNSNKLMYLQDGLDFKQLMLNPEDMTYISSREFDNLEAARIFGVPAVLINENSRNTSWGSGIEQLKEAFVTMCLGSHCTRIEAELNNKLISVDNETLYCKLSMDALLRGNYKDRMAGHVMAVNNGIKTRAEARSLEELPPIEGTDVLTIPSNLGGLDNVANRVLG